MKRQEAVITVTRIFSDKKKKLIDIYADYVAKRVMIEAGMMQETDSDIEEKEIIEPVNLDISDLV